MNGSLLTPRWMFTTIVVIAAFGVMVRLGFWQLDRLEQRKEFNQRVEAQLNGPTLDLNQSLSDGSLQPADLNSMEYRSVQLRGEYRPEEEVLLRNQAWENQPGYHLLTPVYLEGTTYVVLVDRGWIPLDQRERENWMQYQEPGIQEIEGQVQLSQSRRRFGVPDPTLQPGQTRLDAWNAVHMERITEQVEGELLPVFVIAAPDPSKTGMPYRSLEQPDLSEGSHMGYALQWFSFAAVLAIGYPFFVRKQLHDQA
jgi:surfeit locus 1 family protein